MIWNNIKDLSKQSLISLVLLTVNHAGIKYLSCALPWTFVPFPYSFFFPISDTMDAETRKFMVCLTQCFHLQMQEIRFRDEVACQRSLVYFTVKTWTYMLWLLQRYPLYVIMSLAKGVQESLRRWKLHQSELYIWSNRKICDWPEDKLIHRHYLLITLGDKRELEKM